MKQKILLTIIAFAVITSSTLAANYNTNVLSGESLTKFGKYELQQKQSVVVINNTAYYTWELKYPQADKTFIIYQAPGHDKNCCFIVRGNKFEIQYSRCSEGFGAQPVSKNLRTVKKKDLMQNLNNEQLDQQRILTQNIKNTEEYLGLIACFLPLLHS
jgi:hypothetical protein